MPSRSIKNKTRGSQKGALPGKPKLGPGQLVSNYDGRENLAAGSYERRADNDSEKSGRIVEWKK
jgi:hypothetical protein